MDSTTHRPLSSSFLGLPYRILNINHKKELLRGLWVRAPIEPLYSRSFGACLLRAPSSVAGFRTPKPLVAEFRSIKKCTLSVLEGIILSPNSLKCSNSATKNPKPPNGRCLQAYF